MPFFQSITGEESPYGDFTLKESCNSCNSNEHTSDQN